MYVCMYVGPLYVSGLQKLSDKVLISDVITLQYIKKYIKAFKTQLELPGNRTQVFLTIPRDNGVVFCMRTDKLTNS